MTWIKHRHNRQSWIVMQVGVSIVRADCLCRRLHRGGGGNSNDWLRLITAAENCTELCFYGMKFDGFEINWYDGQYTGYDPFYLKCFEASSVIPLNGLRLQSASQVGTS